MRLVIVAARVPHGIVGDLAGSFHRWDGYPIGVLEGVDRPVDQLDRERPERLLPGRAADLFDLSHGRSFLTSTGPDVPSQASRPLSINRVEPNQAASRATA